MHADAEKAKINKQTSKQTDVYLDDKQINTYIDGPKKQIYLDTYIRGENRETEVGSGRGTAPISRAAHTSHATVSATALALTSSSPSSNAAVDVGCTHARNEEPPAHARGEAGGGLAFLGIV